MYRVHTVFTRRNGIRHIRNLYGIPYEKCGISKTSQPHRVSKVFLCGKLREQGRMDDAVLSMPHRHGKVANADEEAGASACMNNAV